MQMLSNHMGAPRRRYHCPARAINMPHLVQSEAVLQL
jgi:hypothetical protein